MYVPNDFWSSKTEAAAGLSDRSRMRRAVHPGSLDLHFDADDRHLVAPEEHPSFGLSDEGSLLLRDLRLNALGGLTGIPLAELELGPELGRGSSSVVFLATYRFVAASAVAE